MTSFTLLVCFPATARCVCRLRVHKVSKQVNLVSNHQCMNAISTLLCCSCISVSWNFLPQTSRKFFAELFRKSTVIFPEISGKIPQEISELTTLPIIRPPFCLSIQDCPGVAATTRKQLVGYCSCRFISYCPAVGSEMTLWYILSTWWWRQQIVIWWLMNLAE